MRLETVTIKNFCSCASLEIALSGFNPIIGYNNSGKSNILRAISWLLRKSVLNEHAFHDVALAVTVEGCISDVDIQLLPQNQQNQVDRYISQGRLHFRRRQDAPNVPAAQVKIDVLDTTTGAWVVNPVGLDNAIGVLFPDPLYIEAMDDAADDIGRFAAKNTIGLLLKYSIEQIRRNNAAALQSVLADLATLGGHLTGPTRLAELGTLESDAGTHISEFFPGLGLHLDIATPSLEDLIKGATVSLSDSHGHQRPFTSFGHGAQRTVQMALIKLLASHVNQSNGRGAVTVLLIDEPELYLHPQAIELLRDSLELLSNQNFQVIFSTHSPLMLGNTHVLNTSMIYRNQAGETVSREKLATAAQAIASHTHQSNVIFSIQNSTYLLFSEKVLVIEGKTEGMLIPVIYKAVTGRTLAQDKSCVIEGSSSSSTWPMIKILRGVGYRPKALVDLDYVFKVAPQLGLIMATDPDFITCKDWFSTNVVTGGFSLGTDGFPTKRGVEGVNVATPPEQAFTNMASANASEVERLVKSLREQDIWVWDSGAIESCLGIQKNDLARMSFITITHSTQSITHAANPRALEELVEWFQT